MDPGFDGDRTHGDGVAYARERDADDPLARFRDRFDVPGEIYLDGNSLGPISDAAERSLDRAVEEWRTLGIKGWTDAERPWFRYGESLGEDLAPLVGADPDEVVVANSTTVNIHTLIGTFLDAMEDRPPGILANELDFPTDHYAIRAQLRQRGYDPDDHFHLVESRDGRTIAEADVIDALEEREIGLVFMPSVLYRSGQLLDVERIAEAAHEHDALVGFDLAHSVGVVPHDLSSHGVDFAVWCSYKYLNAGPGAIAGLYVDERHHGKTPALSGWWGHEKETQFELRETYTPADSAGAWQIGTVPVMSAAPLAGALEIVHEAGIETIRAKSLALTSYLISLVDDKLADLQCSVATPRTPEERGGHVAITHPDAERVSKTLRDRGLVVDFRPPNVIRVCPAPLYTRFEDVWEFAEQLREILADREYESVETDDTVS
ncbi:kynureninase [Natronorubrum sp. JWXQ-INN-674]|uniref:Kynureninase n=1 Tax=Natronorubrum halalkaliphilum TaxID=2691917 RepID=A0A6B0VIQ7_9EURY|nr:kynureninase [Natronorubrum halalkaliphilum]MXV61448.1 kynureninase [Natronorubrum halalkaliphilum]